MRKIQTAALFLLRFLYWETYILLENIFEETQLILLHSHYRFFTWQVTGNAVTPMPIQIFIGFVHAIPRSKILGNRLGILKQIPAAMDYNFYLFISVRYLQFREKSQFHLGNQFHYKKYNKRDRFVFIFSYSIQHETSGYTFYREKKCICQGIFLVHPIQLTESNLYIPQRYVHCLERYQNNWVCISVKNFC